MRRSVDKLPLLLFSSAKDKTHASWISRLSRLGILRQIHRGIYTSDLNTPLEKIVHQNWSQIAGQLYPNAVLGYRSAHLGMPDVNHTIFLVYGNKVRKTQLPGLLIQVLPGFPAITRQNTYLNDSPYGNLFIASEPRRLLENLYTGKNASERTLGRDWVESYLNKICAIRGEQKLNALRDQVKILADLLGLQAQFKVFNTITSALLKTGAARTLRAKDAIARAAGKPYDPDRLEIFDILFSALRTPITPIADPCESSNSISNFAFFEAYFSNYIEGTTFTIEEASQIIFDGKIIPMRNEDSHDVLGTYKAILGKTFRAKPPRNETDFLEWLQQCNYQVLSSRPDKYPGSWKENQNQAGNTLFVHPELVRGTLLEGFRRIAALENPFARALMAMFVVTEVHPFEDGNGRTARLMMNAYLSHGSQCRVMIPTAYREDYLLPLKALSKNHNPEPFLRSMKRAQAWCAGFNYELFEITWGKMKRCNAFAQDLTQNRLLDPRDLI